MSALGRGLDTAVVGARRWFAAVHDDAPTVELVVGPLRRKFTQYQSVTLGGPVIEVAVNTWRG